MLAEDPRAAPLLDAELVKRLHEPELYLGWSVQVSAAAGRELEAPALAVDSEPTQEDSET